MDITLLWRLVIVDKIFETGSFWTLVIFWAAIGAMISALVMNGKTKDEGKVFQYFLLGAFFGIFGIMLAIAYKPEPEFDLYRKYDKTDQSGQFEQEYKSKITNIWETVCSM